ncbi:hypothetical protein [Colwellia echini]|uniref:HEPN AbiU2-like domain-containing protein n=1 Tax=Colwellia echini TaxID=1982103 RepID=A0ABY3MSS3_9GAMM|nr:hypothetical protein [Colwellia echini]TYK64162.1 hypothetical protein CWS31_017125 [Colwellia echini]
MLTNVAKSYLDMARTVIDTQIGAKEKIPRDDAIFGLLSCTYIYSHLSLVSFCTAQLYILWNEDNSKLKSNYPNIESFEALMAIQLKGLKPALNELVKQKNITPLHKAQPKLWQNLNEFLKKYRDFFVHPNPDDFDKFVGETGNAEWQFATNTASGILEYFYSECTGNVPKWVKIGSIKCHGFELIEI